MEELNKYFKSETVEILRSKIHPASYNPRKISNEAKKLLKKSIKQYGVVGGMVVNQMTNNTLVSGHQKLYILDELNNYPEVDYLLKVELISVDLKTEKELNIFFNNVNVSGTFDFDKLRELIPDIDYKNAGLSDEDLSLIGIDFTMQTETEVSIANQFNEMLAPVQIQKEIDKRHVKDVKKQVKEASESAAKDMESYVMINFDTAEAKESFMLRFGFQPGDKVIKGELFENMIEKVE